MKALRFKVAITGDFELVCGLLDAGMDPYTQDWSGR
jgi:hypothetical protein